MAASRLGDAQSAQADWEKARAILAGPYDQDAYYPRGPRNGHWVDWTMARLLEREASKVLKGDASAPR